LPDAFTTAVQLASRRYPIDGAVDAVVIHDENQSEWRECAPIRRKVMQHILARVVAAGSCG
jgi:hypothetical protein